MTGAPARAPSPHALSPVGGPHVGVSLLHQVRLIAWRSIRRSLRQPASLIPPLVFPLLLLTINSAGLADAVHIPGFPADSYLDFLLVLAFMQGALFATASSGTALGQDIDGGFLNRLALTPMRDSALILGQLAGAAALGLVAGIVYVGYGLLLGVEYVSGFGGVLVLLAFGVATAVAFGAVGSFLALRAGSAEGVQGLFPLLFALLFLSTVNMPLELIEAGWFRTIARINPVSYMVDGMRSLIIEGWNARALLLDVLVLAGMILAGVAGSAVALRRRLTRT